MLRADGIFWEDPNAPGAVIQTMRMALRDVAKVLFTSTLLTEEILTEELPILVWDTSIAAEWWHRASETRTDIFPEPMGHYWVWLGEEEDWPNLFRAPIQYWRAELLDVPGRSPATTSRTDAEERSSGVDTVSIELPHGSAEDSPNVSESTRPRKGDATLLTGKRLVNFQIAEEYLGITDRQRQNLMKSGSLEVEGEGTNRKITAASLLKYLPPENPK